MLYVSKSVIPNAGDGLFTTECIESGELIVEFTGRLVESEDFVTNNISSIAFIDGKFLDCYENDLASKANDIINIDNPKRNLSDIVNSHKPIYITYNNLSVNAIIKMSGYKVWLEAIRDIEPDEEIFVHYGLKYWLSHDIMSGNIVLDKATIVNKPIYQYDSFIKYVELFYPDSVAISSDPETPDIIYLEQQNGNHTPLFLIDDLIYREFTFQVEIF